MLLKVQDNTTLFFCFREISYISTLPPTEKFLLLCEADRTERQRNFSAFKSTKHQKNCS